MLAKTRGWRLTVGLMWLSGHLTMIKNTITTFAIIWYFTQQTGSATILALITSFKMIPSIIVTPFCGVLADRFPRKNILFIANLGIGITSVIMGFLFWGDLMKVSYIIALVFLTESFASFIIPLMQVSIPMIAPKEKITKLIGIMTALAGIVGVLGQAGGALLLKFFNIGTIMFINAGIAFISLIPLLFIKIKNPERILEKGIEKTTLITDFIFGIKFIFKRKSLATLIILGFLGTFFFMPPTMLLSLLVKNSGGGSDIYALSMILLSVAYLGCAILIGVISNKVSKITLMRSALFTMTAGIIVLILPFIPLTIRMCVGCILIGASTSLYSVPFYSILTSEVEKEVQGRILSVATTIVILASPAGLAVAGPLSDAIGITNLYIACAAALFLMGFVVINLLKNFDLREKKSCENVYTKF